MVIKNPDEVKKNNLLSDKNIGAKKEVAVIEKTFSERRGVVRILLGFIALILWIFIGISPTIIFSSSLQQFIVVVSFLVRNPILFLLVAFFNIFLGLIVYFFLGIIYWAAFHFIWSIRWFYGYFKYR
jgi:hypothetical protein